MKNLVIGFALLGLLGLSATETVFDNVDLRNSAYAVVDGQCDSSIETVSNFTPDLFVGNWFEVEALPNDGQQGRCQRSNIQTNADGTSFVITQSEVINQTQNSIYAYAYYDNNAGNPSFNMVFSTDGAVSLVSPTNLKVIVTDYISYALVYACRNVGTTQKIILSWKLGRLTTINNSGTIAINNAIAAIPDLNAVSDQFVRREFSDAACFYFPEPQAGQSVVMPGSCDASISAVQNFNIQSFAGTWYEISSYYNAEKRSCPNYEVVPTDNGFNFITNYIQNQAQVQTNATAAYYANDGSGRFNLYETGSSIPIIPFWILSTDYTNYAFAYSCINLQDNTRAISAWKLSRSSELTAAAETAINSVVDSIEVLDERYFEDTDFSGDACFYLPELEAGQPIILPGQCNPDIPTVANFDPASYAGQWYDLASYYDQFQEGTCNDALYTVRADGVVDVYNTQVINRTLDTISGTAVLASTDGSGKLLVEFPVAGTDFTITAEYWILATDYTSYSLVYSCTNLPDNQQRVFSWKLGRGRTFTNQALNAMTAVINSVSALNEDYYITRDHSREACFYLPEPNPDAVLQFRGQCNRDLPAVANFDVERYLGRWFDISSYPTGNQFGTCPTAIYTFNEAGYVEVLNTQVIGQSLNSIEGSASVTSIDGSGKLVVTFPTGTTIVSSLYVSTPYWVLATDYENYALVYSCIDTGFESYTVNAWLLGRENSLSAASLNAISTAIADVPELDDRYFIDREHGYDACFYYPPAVAGQTLIFHGNCDANIGTVNNFNINQFAGVWYEIETYFGENNGECASQTFTIADANSYTVSTSKVIDYGLYETSGVATATGTNGRFSITNSADNTTTPFWILATDYTSYALAYSCVDLEYDRRAVSAWKLSRTTSLPAAAETVVTQTIAPIDVLEEQYFQEVNHDFSGCFVLPDIGLDEPVILSGQCDPNVPVVQNFDAARYAGQWYDIASYYDENQQGTCNDAQYTLTNEGVVNVYNTQVVDMLLDTISGTAVVASDDGSAKLSVQFPIGAITVTSDYWVVATDYTSYSLVYSCTNVTDTTRRIFSWKLGRSRTGFTNSANNNMNQVINSIDALNNRFYITRNHTQAGCFYFPELDVNSAVEFRGQCNRTVAGVANFDVERYLGRWYDHATYPTGETLGTCPNSWYSQNPEGFIQVYNSQVVNGALISIEGAASLQTSDGTGRLVVTYPVQGTDDAFVSTPYIVLATDYDTYSLVYSCIDIGFESYTVNAWRLTRDPSPSNAVLTALDAALDTVLEVDSQYFIQRGHTDAQCAYSPVPTPGQTILFAGTCDESIAAVSNFNFNNFAGSWVEVEAYYNPRNGQCVSYDFTVSTTSAFTVTQSQVYDYTLLQSNLSLTLSSTDGSGRFTLTSDDEEIPFWILATDYTDYALAYSCVNTNYNQKAVSAWKLTRSGSISTTAQTAITQVMQPIDVLDDQYFETIAQDDISCFFIPDEIDPFQPAIFPGQCDPNVPVVENFDPTRYAGQWYDLASYYDQFQEGTCNDALYTLTPEGIVDVYNTQVVNQTLDTINGTAVLATEDGSGKLLVEFPVAGTDFNVTAEYWILATDYTSYALVYSCSNFTANTRRVFSWKLSRTRAFTAQAEAAMDTVIESIDVLNERYYITRDHSQEGCFYFPEPNADTPVEFRGQCNQNVSAVPNFDLERYLGRWFDVSSYPNIYTFGTCPIGMYTYNEDGYIDIRNTQVVNQSLDVRQGFATPTSIDGAGELAVTFATGTSSVSVFYTTSPYWILATDYDNYALVYSCINTAADRYSVDAWLLGRENSLSATSLNAINAVVDQIPELDNRYFVDRVHGYDPCFYYPQPVVGQTVIFPGSCDASVPTVTNFNYNQFAGVWYEAETYFSENNGQCASQTFTLADTNTFAVSTYKVIGNEIYETSGSATGTNGQLNIVNSDNTTTPFWILATDYTSYALAYSCVDLEYDMRAISAWKLSRTTSIPAAAETVIAQTIANVEVLEQRYFQEISHDTDACFALPDLGLNEPVILLGQCDPNIPVVANFDPERYAGQWYDVASYYDQFQEGTCNDALYTLTPAGVVEVYNTQVVNRTLDTINGTAVLASTDGSGKLLVEFPVAGTDLTITAEYWVLATDYTSYSLVYSCRNLTENTRQINSWKLGRTTTLGTLANAVINSVINTIDVLDDRYYITRDHSREGCFYLPDPDPTQIVQFRGLCELNIPVVENFDVDRYLGRWYEVNSYPTGSTLGTCPTADYSQNPQGYIDVYNSQVINQRLDAINGLASLATSDGSAKLVVTYPVGDSETVFTSSPYWVLATDYSNYALVYSCADTGFNSYRADAFVLSRGQTLSAASQAAINAAMDQYPDVDNRYFLDRTFSDEECFYYPDPNGENVIITGQCEAQTPVANFNLNQFAGNWYEESRYPSELQDTQCTTTEFVATNQGFTFSQTSIRNERQVTVTGTATQSSAGIFTANLGNQQITVSVLATDYSEYALLYGCRNIDATRKQVYSWKLRRTESALSNQAQTNINAIIASNDDLLDMYYETTAQDVQSCFYYPEFDGSVNSIVLPGPCNETITAIPNFDVAGYLGTWYEIARYPQIFENGECARATYTLGDEGVHVYNEVVLDSTLDVQEGNAVVASTDGSGLLEVTFVLPIGVTNVANYYVLSTDYDNYALVYSCRNLEDGNRQVSSWKLSRQPSWDSSYDAIIDPIIENTQGLLEDYYTYTDQSESACFYVPEFNADAAPVFRGQCGAVTGVLGFDVNRYAGWWHELEAYPTGQDPLDCVSTNIQASGNTYVAVDTNVVGLEAVTSTNTLTASGDGRLVKTLSDGSTQEIWVLATDYDSYALLYSCQNIDNNTFTVWSAKHSKARSLSTAATTALASVIDNRRDLVQEFYVAVDQSDSTCFHYPEQTTGEVLLPGQCDENIPVQQNFDAELYAGTWYQIEKYPQLWETGECVGTRYTLGNDGEYEVLNWEVVDGELVTIEGSARVVSTDSSARLTVTTASGITRSLYILETDYERYSLAYSCENVDAFTRSVGVWKLSRERTMHNIGTITINAIISQREELHEPYFVETAQNEDCPQPSSAIFFKSSLLLLLATALFHLVF